MRLAPEEPYPHHELGCTLARLRRDEEALDELRRAQRLSRSESLGTTETWLCEQLLSGAIDRTTVELLRSVRGLGLRDRFQSDEAVDLSRSVIELAPECALGHFHLGTALWERDPRGAEEALRRCIELQPDDSTAIDAKLYLGTLRQQAGDEDEAQRIWSEIPSGHREPLLAALAEPEASRERRGSHGR